MKVAAVQIRPLFKEPARNLEQMVFMVSTAASKGAELIVLPELSTTGYSFMSVEDARPFAVEAGQGDAFESMQALSKKFNVAIAWGFMEVEGESLYNSQCMVFPDLEVDHITTRKRNKWGNDHLWATQGDTSPMIVTWRGQKIGSLICRDIRNQVEEEGDYYEPGDADIVAFSSNFGKGGFPAVAWIDFAKENKVTLVVSNRYGEEVHNDFGPGGICVIRPSGKVECDGLVWDAPCIVYAHV